MNRLTAVLLLMTTAVSCSTQRESAAPSTIGRRATVTAAPDEEMPMMLTGSAYRLGVWNIEKLSPTATRGFPELTGADGLPPRSVDDLRAVADLIEEISFDALVVTEVESTHTVSGEPRSQQLDTIAERLGNQWKSLVSRLLQNNFNCLESSM